ncbi:MAG: ATP-binding cassette domain-containing protein, partial [Pseudomonadota bacterium]
AVLNYVQRWSDFNSRYSFVIENFSGDDVMPPDRIYAEAAAAEALSGTLEFVAVEGGPGTGGLTVPLLRVPQGTMVAVQGGSGGGREALLRMAAGVQEPADGRVSFGGSRLIEASLPQIGASIAFVSAEPGLVSKSVRENLLYGLYRGAPDLAQQSDVELLMMLDEARRTGNTTADPMGDWVDFGIADVEGAAELDVRLIDLVETVSLSSEVYSDALNMRLDPRRAEEWSGPIMRARDYLRDSGVDLSDLVEDFDTSGYNRNATLLENVLFALPVDALEEHGDYARHRAVMDVLTEAGAEQEMIAIGWDIASEFSELVDTLDGDSSVLDSFSGYSKADIMAAHDLVIASAGQMPTSPKSDDKILLISLAFEFTEVRDRLDVIDDERRGRLLKIRDKSREIIRRRSDFVSFDEERFSPARRVAENILHGERRHDRRSAWKRLEEEIERAVRAAGLRDDMIRLGLTRQLGSSSGLTSAAKRKIALVRALLKRPNLLVLDGIASTESEADAKLRSAIRLALPGTTIIYAASNQGATEAADLLATIGDNGYIETTKTDAAPGS